MVARAVPPGGVSHRRRTYETLGNESATFEFTATPQLLGTSGGFANPNQVRDFFDDPRLGHT